MTSSPSLQNRPVAQLVPALHTGDAIGDEVMLLHRTFQSWGMQPQIVCPSPDPELRELVTTPSEFDSTPQTILLLHFALPSELTAIFGEHPAKLRILIHHNLTPPRFFAGENMELFRLSRLGQEHLRSISTQTDVAFGDSEFNVCQLQQLGFGNTHVLPILIDRSRFDVSPSPTVPPTSRDASTTGRPPRVLFVGRLVPNKCIHELLDVFSHLQTEFRRDAHLDIVGKHSSEAYVRFLKERQRTLGLQNVRMYGHVSHVELVGLYRNADVFVTMSRHEGFCVPLVECMLFGVPIVARPAGAIPGTLGGAGILLSDASAREAAWILERIFANEDGIRTRLVEAGQIRARQLAAEHHIPRFRETIETALAV